MMYGTTIEFLQYFGLKDLSALPTLKEFQELEAGEEVMEEVPLEGTDGSPAGESALEESASGDPAEPGDAAESTASGTEPATADATEENVAG